MERDALRRLPDFSVGEGFDECCRGAGRFGEAAPINEAVELICRRMGAGQFRAKNLEAALQRVSERVYAPLARHLANASHLIVCPDGQLSRVPFEMLLVSRPGEPPRYLVEEKTVSYVGSGREVARLARPAAKVKTNAPW